MKTAIIVFPGTNREKDMAMALEKASGSAPSLIWHKETDIGSPDLIVLPGGFSYGDYLRCGAMAAHSPIMKEVIRHAERGTRILGVCNGFQMLIETHLLPGALLRNKTLKFICKHMHLRTETSDSEFTSKLGKGTVINVPVAHGDGNYFANDEILKELEAEDRVAFRYCNENGEPTAEANANGSVDHIAGILNKRRTILGMMPHPENATQDWQNNKTGMPLFESIVEALN
ncbi:MAG: phosphoribosylformylglycinamidine synthase subunit PurQ [Rhodospirillales bacterium]|nr:phosphoribosylformylglycinamidine synthase subunit PurQ [Rhodospirillales bacterium]MCB9996638.1 phosphoribosylformylglycinamidine synthase subunit PurQ [Rhodospirillales bacterium]